MTHVESQPEARMQPKPLQLGSSRNPETFNQRSTIFAPGGQENQEEVKYDKPTDLRVDSVNY